MGCCSAIKAMGRPTGIGRWMSHAYARSSFDPFIAAGHETPLHFRCFVRCARVQSTSRAVGPLRRPGQRKSRLMELESVIRVPSDIPARSGSDDTPHRAVRVLAAHPDHRGTLRPNHPGSDALAAPSSLLALADRGLRTDHPFAQLSTADAAHSMASPQSDGAGPRTAEIPRTGGGGPAERDSRRNGTDIPRQSGVPGVKVGRQTTAIWVERNSDGPHDSPTR